MRKRKKINLEDLTDICGGKMTLKELTGEIFNLFMHRSPKYVVITIERDEEKRGYISTINIPHKDFKEYRTYIPIEELNHRFGTKRAYGDGT